MNEIANLLYDYDKTWIIVADKKLSEREKTDAVKTLTALNQGGPFSFVMNDNVIFDIDDMIPISETDYNSRGKKSLFAVGKGLRPLGLIRSMIRERTGFTPQPIQAMVNEIHTKSYNHFLPSVSISASAASGPRLPAE